MRAKFINEVDYKEFGLDPQKMRATSVGQRIQQIRDAMANFQKIYHVEPTEFGEGSKFGMGFEYRDVASYSIYLQDEYANFMAGYEDLKHPSGDEQECETIDDAESKVSNWMDYVDENWKVECEECGAEFDDEDDLDQEGLCYDCAVGECEECGATLDYDGDCPDCEEEDD